MSAQHTPTMRYAKNGEATIPLEAVVGSKLTLHIPVTAICPHCPALLAAAEALSLHIWTERFCPSHVDCKPGRDLNAAIKQAKEGAA